MIAWLALALLLVGAPAWAASLTLTWQDNSPSPGNPASETGFVVERLQNSPTCSGPYVEIGRVGVNITTYVDSSIVGGTRYCYRVAAFNTFGTSAYSNIAGIDVPLAPTPAAPTNLGVAVVP